MKVLCRGEWKETMGAAVCPVHSATPLRTSIEFAWSQCAPCGRKEGEWEHLRLLNSV